jgi:hypothetical protein
MILEYDGVVVDFFEKFPAHWKNIGIHVSGGADSALILYCTALMIHSRDQLNEVKIWPTISYDAAAPNCKVHNIGKDVVKYIQDLPIGKSIQNPYLHTYHQTDIDTESKNTYLREARKYLFNIIGCDTVLDGTTRGMPGLPRPTGSYDPNEEELIAMTKQPGIEFVFPFATVNKKFIAAQYNHFGLKDLSNMTSSCVISSASPCKECWWCKERYWAFGSYDGGVQ